MFATYWHRRYGGDPNQLLRPGDIGGHVMTIVPGTYNPKTGMIGVVDQRGFQMRSIRDMDLRQAAAPNAPGAPTTSRIAGGVPYLSAGMPGMAALGGRIDSATIDGAALDRAANAVGACK